MNTFILRYHSLSVAHYRQYISTEDFISKYEGMMNSYRNIILPTQVIQGITEDLEKIKISTDLER